uniref:Copper transport protein n=1 Tax=Dracunculus medinensis TaxID=318479 RepID=A0A0N4ULS4_DRAME
LSPCSAKRVFTFYRISQALLYAWQMTLAYILMLIAMSFNIWLILAIIFGEAIGYFLFTGELPSCENGNCC